MNNNATELKKGIKDGLPIALGYFAVSFSFGIMAGTSGIGPRQAALMSLSNLTSAGQFAALSIISANAPYGEMAAAQLIINLRYCLMSCSLSQKLGKNSPPIHRFLMGYGITDEIFGVSVCRPGILRPAYFYGLMAMAVPGWTFGTLAGSFSGSLLPQRLMSALSVALYGMFLAVILPPARKNRILLGVVLISMAASLAFSLLPLLRDISSGMKIIILTILIAGIAARLFPVTEEADEEQEATHE